jgi:aminoglycoside 3-N-acetyltransferase
MKETVLFQSRDGTQVTNTGVLQCLEQVRAFDAKFLFIHSELRFGTPNPALTKRELLGALVEAIRQLNVPTLCVPTFTFSFCNGEDFDVEKSRSKMGVLNEYIRTLPDSVRSRDPLMSVAALGEDMSVVRDLGRHSIGENSTFDKLRRLGGTRFLFLGAKPSECMTYVHYVEERYGVPYRYNRDFTGSITDSAGTTQETYTLFVRYHGVIPSQTGEYEEYLLNSGLMSRVACGNGFISAVDEPIVYDTVAQMLDRNIDYFLAEPYPRDQLDRHFQARNMVAL